MELDATVWSSLPAEILERVLQRLPFSSLCRFRLVCKHWNTLPTVRADQPYILDLSCKTMKWKEFLTCCLYSPAANAWDFIDLSFLPRQMMNLSCSPLYWSPEIERFCSDAGLLCVWGKVLEHRFYFSEIIPHYTMLVCNPLTKRCKLLPELNSVYQSSVDLMMKRDCSGEYTIFAVALAYTGEPGLRLRHHVYNSSAHSWTLLLELHRDCCDISLLRSCGVVFEGVYYYISGGGRQTFDLHAYDIKEKRWVADGLLLNLDARVTQVALVISDGRLLLLASMPECFTVHKVDLRGSEAMGDSVLFPVGFTWKRGVAVAYRESIILASESNCRFMAVDLLSLSKDLNEVKAITPVSVIPTSERYTHSSMANVSFDVEATI